MENKFRPLNLPVGRQGFSVTDRCEAKKIQRIFLEKKPRQTCRGEN